MGFVGFGDGKKSVELLERESSEGVPNEFVMVINDSNFRGLSGEDFYRVFSELIWRHYVLRT